MDFGCKIEPNVGRFAVTPVPSVAKYFCDCGFIRIPDSTGMHSIIGRFSADEDCEGLNTITISASQTFVSPAILCTPGIHKYDLDKLYINPLKCIDVVGFSLISKKKSKGPV